ncbi:MAG: DnaJ domain-containing protein [Chrysiogenetes bacterium]|nr:DnaJ domain-containing protein [Chrysiogenetes bacterium]
MASPEESEAARKLINESYARVHEGNHFEVLGLEPEAGEAEIKKAYFQLAKQFHSDAFAGMVLSGEDRSKADEIFGKITDAYNVLSNTEKRDHYKEVLAGNAVEEDEAVEQAQRALRAEMEFQKAEICVKQGNMDEAEQYLRLAIKVKSDEADYWALLGWATYKKRKGDPVVNKQKGKAYLKKALEINPNSDQAYLYMGYIAKIEDKPAIAYDMFRKAVQLNDKNAAAAREAKAFASQAQRVMSAGAESKEKKGLVDSMKSVFRKR